MLFNGGQFLVLFTVFLTIYAFLYKNKLSRTLYVIAFSLFFYYKASGWYLCILVLSILIDYFVAFLIYGSKTKGRKTFWLVISVCANVGLLCYFKYTDFFIENYNFITKSNYAALHLFLPIGISFYTFQTLSYIIDVYKGKLAPTKSLLDYAFYMSFFPHLVAGPIVRARDFLPQIRETLVIDRQDMGEGFYLIIKGLIKKAIFANYISQYADIVYGNPGGYSGFENLIAMYVYALQIYCDFSGYSDMAIGIAKCMGFQLGDNFNTPHISKNITEFWRRWHISLSTWLRDYIYIPLGGNRKGELNQYLFLMITMLIGGFWHGPSWKFVLWGGVHGLGLAIHKLWLRFVKPQQSKFFSSTVWTIFSWALTFHFVAFLWIFFRAATFADAVLSIKIIFTQMDWNYFIPFIKARSLLCVLLVLGYAIQFIPEKIKLNTRIQTGKMHFLLKTILLLFVIQLIFQIEPQGVMPFIYFQF